MVQDVVRKSLFVVKCSRLSILQRKEQAISTLQEQWMKDVVSLVNYVFALKYYNTDGGKVELWDVTSGDSLFSSLAHEDSVTCIKVVTFPTFICPI